jgi:hypothetical protein
VSQIEATYTYTDRLGRPVLRKIRFTDKRFVMQAARYKKPAGLYWKSGPGAVQQWQPEWAGRAMFNLPVLLDALKQGAPVSWVEGERDCLTLNTLMRSAATTNYQGAMLATPEQAEWFVRYGKGRSDINLFIDNDDPGHWAGHHRHTLLVGVGVKPKRIRVWRPKDAAAKDLTDVALRGLSASAFKLVNPSAVEERASAYAAEVIAREGRLRSGRKGDGEGMNPDTGFVYRIPAEVVREMRTWKPETVKRGAS